MADPRTTRPDDPLSAFGPNEWLVDELYEQYLQDKNSVDKAWWAFFADYSPDGTPGPNGGNGAAPTAEVKAAPAPAKAAPAPAKATPAPTKAAPAKAAPEKGAAPAANGAAPSKAGGTATPTVAATATAPPASKPAPSSAPTARVEQKPETRPTPRDVKVAPKNPDAEVTEKVSPLRGPAARVVTNM